MWVAAFFGMATKYAEGLLAIKYRSTDDKGDIAGGPMFYIENGMGKSSARSRFSLAFACILVAFFGIGTFPQVNAIVDSMEIAFSLPKYVTDIAITVLIAAITIGGLQSISRVASKIVPFMAVFYIIICSILILSHVADIPAALSLIPHQCFYR